MSGHPRPALPGAILLCLCAAALPHSAGASTSPVLYYRLRFEFSTTSGWSKLVFDDPDRLLSMRVISQSGPPVSFSADLTNITFMRPCADALSCAAGTVTATADYALAAASLDQALSCSLQKGAWNSSSLQVSVVLAGGQVQTLLKVNHVGNVSDFPNAVPAAVDLSPLRPIPPNQALRSSTGPLIWALYYQWYDTASWSSPILRDHPAFPYVSSDRNAIRRQIAEAQGAGIDGFASQWMIPGDEVDENFRALLDVAQSSNFRVCLYFSTEKVGSREAREPVVISDQLRYVISEYGAHPAYFKVDGKPVIFLYVSGIVPLDTWKGILAGLRTKGLDATYIAMGRDTANLAVFDGLHDLGVFDTPDLAQTMKTLGRQVHYYPLLTDSSSKIWVGTAEPGFDDRLTPWSNNRFKDRQDGAVYRSTFEAAIQSDADWVLIDNWNEWWENAYVEPSELYGDQYLRLTREYAESWTGKPSLANVSSASFQGSGLAPESIVTAFGTHLATQAAQTSLPLPPTSLGGTSVTVIDSAGVLRDAPLFYVSSGQVNYLVPPGTATGLATVNVKAADGKTSSANVTIAAVAPGLFTFNSAALAAAGLVRVREGVQTYEDIFRIGSSGTITSKPIDLGPEGDQVFLILYGTGIRAAGTAGVAVMCAGINLAVSYAGKQGAYAGLDQVNLLLSRSLAGRGDVTIQLTANGVAANPVHVTIQ